MFKRLVLWSGLITLVLLGGLFWFLDHTPPPVEKVGKDVIAVTHMYKDGTQRYVGEVKLPHSCYSIRQEFVRDPMDDTRGTIVITSTDKLLEMRVCSSISTGYAFDVLTDSEKPLTVTLTLDGVEKTISVRDRPWQSARGTTVNDPIGTSPVAIPESKNDGTPKVEN